MKTPPDAVVEYLKTVLHPDRAFAYLQLDEQRCVIDSGGELTKCGIPVLTGNRSIECQIDLLSNVLPVTGDPVVILNTQIRHQNFIDMHIFNYDNYQWVLFFNNSEAGIKLQKEQQTRLSNDFKRESNNIT